MPRSQEQNQQAREWRKLAHCVLKFEYHDTGTVVVSIDHVKALIEQGKLPPTPKFGDRDGMSLCGFFQDKEVRHMYRREGSVPTSDERCHKRPIASWRYFGDKDDRPPVVDTQEHATFMQSALEF